MFVLKSDLCCPKCMLRIGCCMYCSRKRPKEGQELQGKFQNFFRTDPLLRCPYPPTKEIFPSESQQTKNDKNTFIQNDFSLQYMSGNPFVCFKTNVVE